MNTSDLKAKYKNELQILLREHTQVIEMLNAIKSGVQFRYTKNELIIKKQEIDQKIYLVNSFINDLRILERKNPV